MRKKILFISAFLIFAFLLSGCTGGKPIVPEVTTDEDLIRDVLEEFFSAWSEQRWFLVVSYCVDGSPAKDVISDSFEYVNELKTTGCNTVTIKLSPDISEAHIDIDGDEAKAYYSITVVAKCDDEERPFPESGVYDAFTILQKSGGRWKILEMYFLPIK